MGIFSGLFRSRDKPQNRTTGSAYSFFFGGSSAGKRVNERSAMQMTAVYACVRILSEAVAGLPLHLYRYKEDGGKEKAIDHPLYLLLHDEPNPEMSSFVFRETLMTHLLLWGNAYAQIIRNGKGEVIALYPLMPDRMTVNRDSNGQLYYEYTVSMDDAPTVKGSLVRLHPSDVLHIPGLGFDGLVGYSPIAMAKNAIGMAIACEEYGAKFFANGAAPGGVLEHPGTIKDPQRVRESWQSTFGGSGNANKIAVLEEGMKYTPIGISPEQAQFLETRKFQINEIARIFRVPPHMVGDLEKSSFSNIEQQSLEFVKYTLEPWLVRWVFADTLAGKSTHEIAKRLNEQGVVTKKGGRWTPGTINGIIGNEKYTGDVLFQKTYTDNSFNRHQNRGEVDQYLMQNHHEAIISREEFERANAVLKQRGREKGNGHDTGRYQNRYGFSGRIYCGECGGKYKRRLHYKPSGQYAAWTCVTHLEDKKSCSQKYITDAALQLAFVTMMNKLVFGQQTVLRPLLQSLRGLNDSSRLLKIEELETAIEKNREQKQVLTNLMASGYLEPALFNKESNELAAEAETLRQEKEGLMRSVNGDMVKVEELQRLLRFTSKGTMLTEFDDAIFLSFVERITVLSRKEVAFELKCGLSLRERLVEP